jgi:hypothetical protein
MNKPLFEIADILQKGFGYYNHAFSPLPPDHYKVANALMACRTSALGGHIDRCDHCSHERISYNSCRNRHCPKCQALMRAKWVDRRFRELLPVPYFHVVFTLPRELNAFALRNKEAFYSIFFRAVSETFRDRFIMNFYSSWLRWGVCCVAFLGHISVDMPCETRLAYVPSRSAFITNFILKRSLTTFGRDTKYPGAQIGFITILHTWGQNLMDHPHIHCVVPGGGLVGNEKWKHLKKDFLFPIKPLSALFKGKMLDYFKAELQNKTIELHGALRQYENPGALKKLLDSLYEAQWIVYAKPPFAGPKAVFRYLGRYTHRIAISNNRIVSITDKSVTFSWKDYADGNKRKNMTLPIAEFIRRFLLHVIPTGFVRIRHYGFLSNRDRKAKLHQCLYLLGVLPQLDARMESNATEKGYDVGSIATQAESSLCPVCKKGHMKTIREIPRGAPPPADETVVQIAA